MKDLALIIGAGIGGLSTGALLAKRGWRVIILEQSSRIGGCCGTYSKSGFKFALGATVFPDFLWSGLDLVFRELELALDRIFLDPFSQICLPGHRMGLYRDEDTTWGEWAREFPKAQDEIKGILKHLRMIDEWPPWHRKNKQSRAADSPVSDQRKGCVNAPLLWSLLWGKRLSGRRLISKGLKKSLPLAGFDLQTLFWGQAEFSEASLAYSAKVMGLPQRGGFSIKGGSDSMCRLLSDYIQAHGGQIRLNSNVNEILVEKEEAVGLRLKSGEIIKGRCYIANTTPWGLYERLLPEDTRTKPMLRRLYKAPYPRGVFTLFLGVKQACLPSQMSHEVFFSPKPYTGSPPQGPFFIAISPLEDPGRAPPGCRAMTISQYTHADEWYQGDGYAVHKKKMQERTLQALKDIIPFLDEGICVFESATPLTYERFTARPGGMVKGVPQIPAVFYNKAFSEKTCYRHLFMIGDCIAPGLGVEGVCRASLKLADWICKRYD